MPFNPRAVRAVLEALQVSAARGEQLGTLNAAEWSDALAFCDRMQLTFALLRVRREHFPKAVRQRLERNLDRNTQRFDRIREAYSEIARLLGAASVEFAVLKGFSHVPQFVEDPRWRVQYDLDVFCPR